MAILLVTTVLGFTGLYPTTLLIFLFSFLPGIYFSQCLGALAGALRTRKAGSASALMGAIQMSIGAGRIGPREPAQQTIRPARP